MLLEEDRRTEAGDAHKRRSRLFGAIVGKKARSSRDCQFSLLPEEELSRLATGWYAAAAEATLNSNFSPLAEWIRRQTKTSAQQNFQLGDVLELLRLFRTAAIQQEKWAEDTFSVLDEVINETLQSLRSEVPWEIPTRLNYLSNETHSAIGGPGSASPVVAAVAQANEIHEPWSPGESQNRRDFGRNRLKLPIRVRAAENVSLDELAYSENVSRSGLYFLTRNRSYKLKMSVMITYPYWSESGAINCEYKAKVLRMDAMTDGSWGVAVEFTQTLGSR
jgi:hypothetical protein